MNYDKIKKKVSENNSVTQYSVSITGIGLNDICTGLSLLKFVRECILYDLYYPYIFRFMVGCSTGALFIGLALNAMYIYEKYDKINAIGYLDSLSNFLLNYDNVYKLFTNTGAPRDNIISNTIAIIGNLLEYGSFFERSQVYKLLIVGEGITEIYVPENDIFISNEYYDWLNERLDTIYIGLSSSNSTIYYVYTGTDVNNNVSSAFLYYRKMDAQSFFYTITLALSTPLISPVQYIIPNIPVTNGTYISLNINQILDSITNKTYFKSANENYGKLMNFFNIQTNDFLIISNKLRLQKDYEYIATYPSFPIPILQSISSILTVPFRRYYYSFFNTNLMSITTSQIYSPLFSLNNYNNIVGKSLQSNINNISSNTFYIYLKKLNLSSVINPSAENVKILISNQPFSSYITDLIRSTYKLNDESSIVLYNMFSDVIIRTLYPNLDLISSLFYSQEDVDKYNINNGMGIVWGGIIFDFYRISLENNISTILPYYNIQKNAFTSIYR
jgi:hypothetical protein